MRILLFGSPDAPANMRIMACYLQDGELPPVRHTGSDPAKVRERAQAWWDAEVEKARQKIEMGAARAVLARKKKVQGDG